MASSWPSQLSNVKSSLLHPMVLVHKSSVQHMLKFDRTRLWTRLDLAEWSERRTTTLALRMGQGLRHQRVLEPLIWGMLQMPCLVSSASTPSVEGGLRPRGRGSHGLLIASFTILSTTSSACSIYITLVVRYAPRLLLAFQNSSLYFFKVKQLKGLRTYTRQRFWSANN